MKKIILILLISLFANFIYSQIAYTQIKDLNDKTVNTKTIIENDGCPVLICFFATWCKPCIKELNALNEQYSEMNKQTGVKIIAISIDNSRSSSSVAPFVNASGWEFDVYLDVNGSFKRAMNVNNVPHIFLLDGDGKIIWQHTSYLEGDETVIYEMIKKLTY